MRLDGTNPESQHRLLTPRSAKLVLNAVDEENDALWLPGHSFATGDVVTYSHESEFGAIEGLVKGRRYLVVAGGDWISLRPSDGSPDDASIQLSQGSALGSHSFTADDAEPYRLELGRIDADTDTVYIENHGLAGALGGWAVYSRTGDAIGLPELLGGSEYGLEVVDADSFRLRDTTTGEIVEISDHGTASSQEFGIVDTETGKTFQPNADTVDAARDTITIENHGFRTGDIVFYRTDPDNATPRTVPAVDLEAPALSNSVTFHVPDPAIGDLRDGAAYKVIVVDEDTLRLVPGVVQVERAQAIDLSGTGVQGDEHALVVPGARTGGINVSANLVSVHYAVSDVVLGGAGFKFLAAARYSWKADGPLVIAMLGIQFLAGMGGAGQGLNNDMANLSNETTRGNAGKTTLGATVTINYVDQEIGAEIGASGDSAPDLDSGMDITVSAGLTEWQHVYARGWITVLEASATGSSTTSQGVSKDGKGGSAVGLTIGLGIFLNDVYAIVAGNATLDAAGTISVTSHLLQPFSFDWAFLDPSKTFQAEGIRGLYQLMDGTEGIAWYLLQSWVDTVVFVSPSKFEGRQPSVTAVAISVNVLRHSSKAIIESGVRINRDPVFEATDEQSVKVEAKTEVWQLELAGTGNLQMGNIEHIQAVMQTRSHGLGFEPLNRTSGRSVGGVAVFSFVWNTTIARIEPGVAITIGPSGRLDVHGKEYTLRVNIAGRGAQSENEGREKSSGLAFAGSAVASVHVSDTQASIESEDGGVVDVQGRGDVEVSAVSELINVNFAGSIAVGKGGASSVGVGVVLGVVVRDTEAFVGRPSSEDDVVLQDTGSLKSSIGRLVINARNEGGVYAFALAGSVAAGTGQNAKAPAHRRPETASESRVAAFLELPGLPAAHKNTVNRDTGGLTLAASLVVNVITQNTQASLNGGGTFETSTVDIAATDSTTVVSGSGGAAISYQKKQDGVGSNESKSTSGAGAVSVNVVYTRVRAFIRGVKLTSTGADEDGSEVAVRARREGNLYSFSIALAADGSSNAKAFSGSASINIIEGTTHAFIAGAVITAKGDVEVKSKNTVVIWSIGGGAAGSRNTGVGASISYNHIAHDTRAWIVGENGQRASLVLVGGLTLHAENANAIHAAAVSVGVSASSSAGNEIATAGSDAAQAADKKKGLAGAFTLAVNIIAPEWSIIDRARGEDVSERGVAVVIDNADVVTGKGEDVRLTAVDNPSIVAIAGGLAIGAKASAFGAALGWNQINSRVRVLVTNSRITAGGALSLRAEKGTTKLAGQATITTAAIGGAGSKDGGAVGISAAVNGIISRVEAEVAGGSVIQAEEDVVIKAEDTSSINALTGAVGVSLKSYAGGAGVSGNYIDNQVKARVDGSTVKSSSGDVEISAKQEANVRAATVGVAVSAKNGISLAGSIGIQVVAIETIAGIEGASRVTAAHNVRVRAESDLTVGAGSGQLSISGSGKFAGGAALNFTWISSRTEASIGKDAKVSTTSASGGTFDDITGKPIAGISVEAASDVFVLGIAVGGSVGSGVSAAASGTVNVVKSVTEARVEAKGDSQDKGVDSARDVNVVAESNLFASGTAGALGAGKVGVGIGVDVGAITHHTSAYIGAGATVEADDSVFVRALAAESIVSVSAAVSGASKVAVGASAGVAVLRSRTRAYIGDGATVWAYGNILVSADSDTKSWIASASVAVAGKVAVGVGFQIGVLEKSTKAYIGDATVTALANDDAVEVSSGAFGDALGFSGADVNAGQDRITIEGHNLDDGDRVVYSAPTALTGLQDGTIYYAIRVDADTIRLAASRGNAENGVAVNIGTSNGSAGAAHLLRRVVGDEDGDAYADFKTSAVDAVSDTISADGHGFVDGQEVLYFTDAVVLGGMSTEGRYYVIRVDDDSFKLATTREDALEGTAIDLDTTGLDSEQGHHIKALADESLPEVDNAEADATLLSADSDREALTVGRKGVIVVAVSTNDVGTAGAGVAIAASGAGALTGAVTVHTIDTSAHIARGAAINTVNPGNRTAAGDQDVHVNAARVYRSVNVGLAVAGAGKFAAAPAFAAPILKGATTAYIQGATSGGTYDTSVTAQRDVTVTAHAESEMYAVTAGAALAVAGVSLAGSVNVLVVDTETLASISGRVQVTAGGNVLVSASDDTRAINFAGGVGLVGKGFAGAGAVPVTVITKRTTAVIDDHAIVDAAGRGENSIALAGARAQEKSLREAATSDRAEELLGDIRDDQLSDDKHREVDSTSEADSDSDSPSPMRGVAVQARSSEDIHTLGASASLGILAGNVGITVSVTFVDSDTVAAVGAGVQINQNPHDAHENQSVDVDARNVLEIFSVAGALGGGGIVGVGAGVDIGIVRNDTQALVGSGARIRANADVNVNAVSIWVIDSAAVGAGISGIAGIAGGIVVYVIGGNFSDSHDHGSALSGDDGDAGGFSNTAVSNNFAQVQQEDDGAGEFDPASSVDSGADTVDVGSAHGLSTGDAVLYHTGGGEAIGGLEEGEFYFAIVDSDDPGKVRLAATREDALAGRAIDIDASNASGSTHRLSNDSKGLGDAARTANRDSLPDGRVGSAINNRGSLTSGTVAGVESGVDIRARDVNVTTLQILDVDAYGGAVAGSILFSVGVGAVVLNVDADVASYIRPGGRITGDGEGDLRVTAHSSTELDARAYAGSLAGSVAVAASVVFVDDASSVDALLGAGLQGGNINETAGPEGALVVRGFNVVSVQARGYFHQQTLAGAVAAGGFAGGAPGLVFGSLSPEVHAVIGAHTELGPDDADTEASNVGSVSVDAFAEVDAIPLNDQISVFALGIGALGALGAGFAQIDVSPTVLAMIGTGALIDADGAVRVTARADINARVNADGAAGSLLIGVGAMIGKVSITSDVRARVESRARIKASSIRIKAAHAAEGRTETTPSSAGILAGTGSDARTEIGAEVEAEVGEWAVLEAHGTRDSQSGKGGDIDVEAVSVTEAHANARGHSYGLLVTAGFGKAYAEAHSETSVTIGDHAAIESLNADVSLDAHANDQLEVSSWIRGGAAIQVSEARSAGKIGGGTSAKPEKGAQTVVGEGARITATRGDVDVAARFEAHADVRSDARSGGIIGIGIDAESDLEVLSATKTEIGSGVTINALNVRIRASVDTLDLDSEADSTAEALIALTDAAADTEVRSNVGVDIQSNAHITGRSVVIEALHGSVDDDDNLAGIRAASDAKATAAAGFMVSGADAETILDTETRVDVAAGAEITALNLRIEASADPNPTFSSSARVTGGSWLGQEDRNESSELTLDRTIDFNGRIVVLPAPSPFLVLDEQGLEERNVGDIQVTLIGDSSVYIGDIRLRDRALGTVEFKIRASDYDSDDDDDTTTSRVLRGQPTIVYTNSFESVTIVNRSNRDLKINDIEVVHDGSAESRAPIVTAGIDGDEFEASYDTTTNPTRVIIEHTGSATAGIILAGAIDNAIGSTAITATHGGISSKGTEVSITTASLDLNTAGSIAGSTSALPLLVATRTLEVDAATVRIEDKGFPGGYGVDVVHVIASAGSVYLKAVKSIRAARGGSSVNVDADTIELISVEGSVGEVGRALRIDAGAHGDALSIAAARGVHVSDVANGLSIDRVTADAGDIVVTVENTPAGDDDLTLDASALIQATAGSVVLRAGDRIELRRGSTIDAAGRVELNGDASRSTEFQLNAVNEAEDEIWLAGHSFVLGDVVTYADRSRFGAIGGLGAGARYEVIEVDGDWVKLQKEDAETGDPALELSQGDALGLHVFTADDGRASVLVLGRVDADGTLHAEDHALADVGGQVQYRRLGSTGAMQGLQQEAWYRVRVAGTDTFSLLDLSTFDPVAVSGGDTAGAFALVHPDADNGEGAQITVSGSISGTWLVIRGGRDADTFDVESVSIATRIEGGDADDTIRLGAGSAVLGGSGAIAAAVTVVGGSGSDTLRLDDSSNDGPEAAVLSETTVSGLGMTGGGRQLPGDRERGPHARQRGQRDHGSGNTIRDGGLDSRRQRRRPLRGGRRDAPEHRRLARDQGRGRGRPTHHRRLARHRHGRGYADRRSVERPRYGEHDRLWRGRGGKRASRRRGGPLHRLRRVGRYERRYRQRRRHVGARSRSSGQRPHGDGVGGRGRGHDRVQEHPRRRPDVCGCGGRERGRLRGRDRRGHGRGSSLHRLREGRDPHGGCRGSPDDRRHGRANRGVRRGRGGQHPNRRCEPRRHPRLRLRGRHRDAARPRRRCRHCGRRQPRRWRPALRRSVGDDRGEAQCPDRPRERRRRLRRQDGGPPRWSRPLCGAGPDRRGARQRQRRLPDGLFVRRRGRDRPGRWRPGRLQRRQHRQQ